VDEVSCCVFVMDMRQVESQSGWQKRLSVVGLGVAELILSSLMIFALQDHMEFINLGRLVHGIDCHPNRQVNVLLSIPSELHYFSVDGSRVFTQVSFCPLLGDSQQVSQQLAV